MQILIPFGSGINGIAFIPFLVRAFDVGYAGAASFACTFAPAMSLVPIPIINRYLQIAELYTLAGIGYGNEGRHSVRLTALQRHGKPLT